MTRFVPKRVLRSLALVFPLDWNIRRTINLSTPGRSPLGPYYIEWTGSGTYGEDWVGTPFDDAGVILSAAGGHHLPTRIAQYGLQKHADWLRGDSSAKQAFLAQATWFRDNQSTVRAVHGCYAHDMVEPEYLAQPPWMSALPQSEGISLLLRAEDAVPDSGFGAAAVSAAEPFCHTVADGGVVWNPSDGVTFFEEYAVPMLPHVFNGNLYALIGLIELSWRMPEPWLVSLIASGLETTKRFLPRFDAGFWSCYSGVASRRGFRRVAVLKYHAFHIALLRVLAALTGENEFAAFADRYDAYQRSWYCRMRVWANMARWLFLKYSHLDDFSPEHCTNVFS